MGLVFNLGPVGMDHLSSAWCWLILLSWGQRIQDGVTHVWCLDVSCWLVLFSSLPCGFFFFPHSLSLPSILTHSFLKTCFLASKNGGKNNTRSLKTQAQAQNHVSSLLPHSVGEWSHKATPESGKGKGPQLLMKDYYACTGIGGIICGCLASYLYNTLLFLSFYNALLFLVIFFDATQSFITDYLPYLNTSNLYHLLGIMNMWKLFCCSFFLLKNFVLYNVKKITHFWM